MTIAPQERETGGFLLVSTLLMGSAMTVMAGATISPALPQMNAVFQGTPHAGILVKLLLSVHALFIAISAPFMGLLMDRYGRKPILLASVTLYGLAGSSGFFLDSLYAIILGRALLGISVAGIMSGFTTLIGDYFDGEQRFKVMGYQAAFTGFGGLLFLTAGGVLADMSWRYPFLIYLYAFMVLPGVAAFLYEPQKATGVMDPGNTAESTSPASKKLIFIIYFLAFFGMLVFYMIPVQLPFHLKTLGNISNTRIGIGIGMMNLVGAVSSMQFKRVRKKLSHAQIYMVFSFLMGLGYITIYLAAGFGVVVLGLIIAGMGFGLLMPNVNVWVVSLAPPAVRGRFVGGLTTFFLLGQFVSPLLVEPIVRKVGIGNTFFGTGLLLLAVAAGCLLYPQNPHR